MKVFTATTSMLLANLGLFLLASIVIANYSPSLLQALNITDANDSNSYSELTNQAFELTKAEQTEETITEVIELCEKAILAEAKDHSYAERLASWAYTQQGKARTDLEESLNDFDRAIELDDQSVLARHNRAITLGKLGRLQDSLTEFDETLQLNPDFARAWHNRAEIRFALSEFEIAIRDYDKAIDLDSSLAEAYTGRGHAQFKLGKFEESLKNHNFAVRFARKSSQAFANRAETHQVLEHWEKSLADYRSALQIDQTNGEIYRQVAWLMATCPDPRQKNPELALQAAERAIELTGDDRDSSYLDTLATAQAACGQFEEALKSIQLALRLSEPEEKKSMETRLALFTDKKAFTQGETLQR